MKAHKTHRKTPAAGPSRRHKRPVGLRRIRIGGREIITKGIPRAVLQDLYFYFMTVSWPQLFATFALFFLSFDLFFGLLYGLVPGCIANLNPPGFAGAFFFSVETLATVGYGDMHPINFYGHTVAMLEIFVGLMSLALITGIMFARFSRPKARFLFAHNAVVRPIDGKRTLMFRAANERQNVVQEATARLRLLRDEVTVEGYRLRRVTGLRTGLEPHARDRRKQPLIRADTGVARAEYGRVHLERQWHGRHDGACAHGACRVPEHRDTLECDVSRPFGAIAGRRADHGLSQISRRRAAGCGRRRNTRRLIPGRGACYLTSSNGSRPAPRLAL
jgi:hypothetical protein